MLKVLQLSSMKLEVSKLEGCPGARAETDKFVIQKLCHDTHGLTLDISNAMENAIHLPSPLRSPCFITVKTPPLTYHRLTKWLFTTIVP